MWYFLLYLLEQINQKKREEVEEEGRKGGEQRGEMTKQKLIGYISK